MRPQGFLKMKKKKRENAHSEDFFWANTDRGGERERGGGGERESFHPISPREKEGGREMGLGLRRPREEENKHHVCLPPPLPLSTQYIGFSFME